MEQLTKEFTAEMKTTMQNMFGRWSFGKEGDKEQMFLTIRNEDHELHIINEEIYENHFSGGAWQWDGDKSLLCFDTEDEFEPKIYFIRKADANTLVFGELESNVLSEVKWERTFERM
jgi:hypothetical protein